MFSDWLYKVISEDWNGWWIIFLKCVMCGSIFMVCYEIIVKIVWLVVKLC